ncbi:MAG TPA: hypothetical protein VND22_06995 [Actinomycetota bacterium]|nr:hypothetical protein [Actinomycetota bacterium]
MARDYEGKIEVLTVPGQDREEAMQDFVEKYGLTDLVHIPDKDEKVWPHFGVTYRGTWVYIDDDGTVKRELGHLNASQIRTRFDTLIAS